ncbi:MAG: RDD family protein [Gammaproteobacteria bacterium]|nr:RDD family protein [Gammaproteobacteria bacterium]
MTDTPESYCKPSIFRYLGIMIYDTLLLLSVLLFASALAVGFNALVNNANAIESGNPFFPLYLVTISFIFYGWFWTHGGQTLGMRSWKVYLVNGSDTNITWRQAFIRFVVGIISWLPAGMGYWWLYFGKNKQSWLDIMSRTRLHYSENSQSKPLSRLS